MTVFTSVVKSIGACSFQITKNMFGSRVVTRFWGGAMLGQDENGEGDIRARAYLQEKKGAHYPLKGASEICYRDMNVGGKSERMVTIQRRFHGIAICQIIFGKQ
jgi:hypothetical protein